MILLIMNTHQFFAELTSDFLSIINEISVNKATSLFTYLNRLNEQKQAFTV